MSFARLRFAIALIAFLAWLTWLAVAVAQKGTSPVVSRAQLAAASHLVVCKVTVGDDGLPAITATVVESLSGPTLRPGEVIEVLNLNSAMPPGASALPGEGEYLLPLVGDRGTYRVAGLPRSPGYEAAETVRPAIYRYDAATRAQLRGLGVKD